MFTRTTMVAALVAVMCACGEQATPTGPGLAGAVPSTPSPSAFVEMAGYVETNGPSGAGAYLKSGGELYRLYGSDADAIANLAGAEIVVRGTRDGPPGIMVESFRVLAVRGRSVFDGVVMLRDGAIVLLLSTGDVVEVADAPAALAGSIGHRVWLAPATDADPIDFGVII